MKQNASAAIAWDDCLTFVQGQQSRARTLRHKLTEAHH
jgi:hypothetical protein